MAVSDSSKILLIRITLFSIYVLLGAVIFQAIESEPQKKEVDRVHTTRMEILNRYKVTSEDAERWAKTFASTSMGNEDFLQWNYGNSFLFAMVVLTTIGYGNIVPKTVQGRLFCVLYALIGIPGTCLTLKAVGDKITEVFTKLITTFEKRVLKRSNTQNVGLKVALTTIVVTLVFLLPLMALLVYARHKEWSYVESFYFTFTTLSTIGFGDYLPQFKNNADYLLVPLAFVGLAFISSIFCSMNNVLEQYGVSARVVRSLREKNKSSEEKSSNNKEDSSCNGNEIVAEGSADNKKDDLNNSLLIKEDNTKLDNQNVPISGSGRNSFGEETTMENRKRESSVSLGIFTC